MSRKLLVAILHRFGLFNPEFVSKNFSFDVDQLDGYIIEFNKDRNNYFRKFFLDDNSQEFFNKIYSIKSGTNLRMLHLHNIKEIEIVVDII